MKASEPAQHLEGDFCFVTESKEYLSLHCSNGSITGKMYLSEEYFGEIFYEFEGKFINDSVAQIRIKNDASSEPVTEKWQFNGQNTQILVLENTVRDENTAFKRINCDLLPDLTPYRSVQDNEENDAAEASENPASVCYHKYYPHNGGRTRVSEYISILFRTETVSGSAAGYSEGDGEWSMRFTGTALDDNTFLITAKYTDANGILHLTSEQWQVDSDKTSLKVLSILPNDYRSPGEDFHKIDCENTADWAQELLYN